MTTREVYYKVYAESELPVALIGFASKDKFGVIQLFQSVWLCFHDGHEVNIKKMEKVAKGSGFMFWNNSPDGEKFFDVNKKEIGKLFAKIILNQK
jgi:hypothetical protein